MIRLLLALGLQNPVLVAPAPAVDGRTPVLSSGLVLLEVDDLVGTAQVQAKPEETPEQRKTRATLEFGDILRRWMKPAFEPEKDRIEVVGPGRIALSANSEKTLWAERFCEVQRKAKGLVYVQTQIVEAPQGTLASFGVEGPTKAFDAEADAGALLARFKDHEGTNLLMAPRLLVFPRSQAQMSVGESVSYVADWRMEIVEPGPQSIGVPTVETVFDGIVIHARAVPLDHDLFGLELEFTSTKLQRPIPTKTIRIGSGDGKEVEIGLPEVRKVGLDTRMTLASGASLLFQTLSSEEGREIAVAVTLRAVEGDVPVPTGSEERTIEAKPR